LWTKADPLVIYRCRALPARDVDGIVRAAGVDDEAMVTALGAIETLAIVAASFLVMVMEVILDIFDLSRTRCHRTVGRRLSIMFERSTPDRPRAIPPINTTRQVVPPLARNNTWAQ
jgi:hypothetical protein